MGRAPGRQRRAAFPSLFPKLGDDPIKDFAPVTTVAFSPHALVVHPSVPANTVPELVAYAKSKPDGLNFANPGVGTLIQLAAEQFKTLNGIKLTQVPYKGGAQAVLGLKRSEALPDVPTLDEAALPGFQSGSWQGLLAPAGTPKDIITKLNAAVVEILKTPDMKQQLRRARGGGRHGYAGAIRRLHSRRPREMEQGREGGWHQSRVSTHSRAAGASASAARAGACHDRRSPSGRRSGTVSRAHDRDQHSKPQQQSLEQPGDYAALQFLMAESI